MKICRLYTKEEVIWAPDVKRELLEIEKEFIEEHKDHGTSYEYKRIEDIPFMTENTLVVSDDPKLRPWYANFSCMLVMDLLMLGWLLRIKLESNTFEVKYTMRKIIYE